MRICLRKARELETPKQRILCVEKSNFSGKLCIDITNSSSWSVEPAQPFHLQNENLFSFHQPSRLPTFAIFPWLFSFSDSLFATKTNLFLREKITVWCYEQSRKCFFLVIDRSVEWQSSTFWFCLINSTLRDTYSKSTTVYFIYSFQFIIVSSSSNKWLKYLIIGEGEWNITNPQRQNIPVKFWGMRKLNHESSLEFLKNSDCVITFSSCFLYPSLLATLNVFSVHDSAIYLYDDKYFFGEGWRGQRRRNQPLFSPFFRISIGISNSTLNLFITLAPSLSHSLIPPCFVHVVFFFFLNIKFSWW